MKKVQHGYADYYYLLEDGTIYNADTEKIIFPDKHHLFTLKTEDDQRKKISLKTLYYIVYNVPFCKDDTKDLEGEEWKEIQDTGSLYYISNKGRVKSYQGYSACILKPYKNQSGYLRVDIIESKRRKTMLVHKLVAEAFLQYPKKEQLHLHHKDFNKENCQSSNLEWLTIKEHTKIHRGRKKRNVGSKSEKNSNIENQ